MEVNERIFALDIGTRSVVGIILEKKATSYQVIDIISKEHDERSMVDGQIHDVLSVSKVISSVKESLEEKHGPLHKVCVAAAGRALKTKRTRVEVNIESQPLMNQDDVTHLELSAVQQAQYDLAKQEEDTQSTHYYCVGYSVIHYHLDGEEIGSLIDQQGKIASAEIIATFLPKVVVESLISALQRSGLEMEALTLEPIAAIDVLIPASMRRLNVALVDIGAGTSDIAITELGTVTAYGMVPNAGDEITEAISDQYLLDFPLAEKAKRDLSTQDAITVTDILGFETDVPYEEAVRSIQESIKNLSNAIHEEILSLNNKPPKAVMLVGGGSLTPELPKQLAESLGLPENRVAIRGIDAIQSLEKTDNLPEGPAFVTPIGIAIAAKQNPVHYISVQVNDRAVRLFDMKTLTVGDCLLAAGIEMKKLYGKPGMAYMIKLNGKEITLPGNYGTTPTIELNGEPCSLNETIQNGDVMNVSKGKDGEPPNFTLEELIGDIPSFSVLWNEERYDLQPKLLVNGDEVPADYKIKDNDQIEFQSIKTINDFFESIDEKGVIDQFAPFSIYVNNRKQKIKEQKVSLLKNNAKANLRDPIHHGDQIITENHTPLPLYKLMDQFDLSFYYTITVMFNNEYITLSKQQIKVFRDGESLTEDDLVYPDNQLLTEEVSVEPFIFQDVFRFVDIDIQATQGRRFRITKNGEETTFFEQISPGDELELQWETSNQY
ncbi:cell division protein [Pontibacillus sp. HMF3514]|nr:cell division protein [Pontibacillus sp. HMF3514]